MDLCLIFHGYGGDMGISHEIAPDTRRNKVPPKMVQMTASRIGIT